MWQMLAWRRLADPEIAREIDDLRGEALRLFMALSSAGYVVWHFGMLLAHAGDPEALGLMVRLWLLFGLVAGGLMVSWRERDRAPVRAAVLYVGTGFVTVTTLLWLL